MATTAKETATAAPPTEAAQAQPEQTPDAGGRYTRLPDGTLAPNPDTSDTTNTTKD